MVDENNQGEWVDTAYKGYANINSKYLIKNDNSSLGKIKQ